MKTKDTPEQIRFNVIALSIFFVIAILIAIYVKDQHSAADAKLAKAQEIWGVLSGKSEAHGIIVSAYRDCRVSDRGSITQCHIVAKDYAELKAVGLKFPEVLAEIEITSLEIISKIK
jgi:hypothetical protein